MNRKFWIILMLVYISRFILCKVLLHQRISTLYGWENLDSKAIVKNGTLRLPLRQSPLPSAYSMDTSIQDQLIIKTTDDNAITIDLTEAKSFHSEP
jgi:hypothetical protein